MYKLVHFKPIFLLFLFFSIASNANSQKTDSTKVVSYFDGVVKITNNGISTIPNLSLGKPAAIFGVSAGRKLRFEPEFRFALEGKPWTFIFWWRYQLLDNDKFKIRVGANTSLNCKPIVVTSEDFSDEIIWGRRFLTGDLSAGYLITKNISIGTYIMYIHGIEKHTTRNTNLFAIRTGFSNITLSSRFFMRFNSQAYYLKMDEYHGFYFNANLDFVKRNFPLSISAIINKAIKSEIPVGEDFLWNVSLIYSFNKKFVEQK